MSDPQSDSTFDALDEQGTTVLGPSAALLYGYELKEGQALERLISEIAGAPHPTVCCTKTMGALTVGQALGGTDEGELLPVGEIPRVVLLSGLTDKEVGQILDRYGTLELPRPIFAVATSANLELTVIELLEELLAERRAMERG